MIAFDQSTSLNECRLRNENFLLSLNLTLVCVCTLIVYGERGQFCSSYL